MDRTPPAHFGRSSISNLERFGWWIRYHRNVALGTVLVTLACAGGSTYLLVHTSRVDTVPVTVTPVIEASSPDVAPSPTLPAGNTVFTPVTPPPTIPVASKTKPTASASQVAAASVPTTTIPRPPTTAGPSTPTTTPSSATAPAGVVSTASHLTPVTTTVLSTTTTTLPSLASWYTLHRSDVAALQAADESLWTTSVAEVSEGPQSDLTPLIAQVRHAVAVITKDLPSGSYPALDQAMSTLTQATQDFVSWQEDPAGTGFHDGTAALFSGDAAVYQALVGAGVPSSDLRSHL